MPLAGSRAPRVIGLAEQVACRYRDPALVSAGLTDPICASLAHGAAGVAYFLLRHASLGGRVESLESARPWAAQAEHACRQEGAFAAVGASTGSKLTHSLHYGEPGVWWVGALVAAFAGDRAEARQRAGRFLDMAEATSGTPGDVTAGSAGLLLACAQLVESLDDAAIEAPAREAGDRLALELAAFAECDGAMPGETVLGYLGAAHGWAGVAHTLLRWSWATSQPPAQQALALLERLIARRRPSGRWPVRPGSREVYRGWCHGSAGWAQLWTLAWQLTGDDRLLAFAEHSAEDAVSATDEGNQSLCCGRAGQGFAALTLYRATGERRWLTAAHRVAADAVRALASDTTPTPQLFSGELGVALLVAELEDSERAAMPVYEALRVNDSRPAGGPRTPVELGGPPEARDSLQQ
jgi:serine/threonine-protein kinase